MTAIYIDSETPATFHFSKNLFFDQHGATSGYRTDNEFDLIELAWRIWDCPVRRRGAW